MGIYTKVQSSQDNFIDTKARLLARGSFKTYKIDDKETSPKVCLKSKCNILSLARNLVWCLHQLDVSNVFLYGDFMKCVNIEQPLSMQFRGRLHKYVISIALSMF